MSQRFASLLSSAIGGEIAQRNDTNQTLVAIKHRQPTDLKVAHVLEHVLNVLIVKAISDFLTHDVANLDIGTFAFGDTADGDVAVGDHSHQTVILLDR